LAQQQDPNRAYLTLDDSNLLRASKKDPDGFVAQLPARVTLDEIQRAPELLLAIKRSVDMRRTPGKFLLTGSANLLQMPRLADSLAGRMECIYLQPLSESEKRNNSGRLLERLIGSDLSLSTLREDTFGASRLPAILVKGGYPEPMARSFIRARQWHRQYLKAVIERDVHDIAKVRDSDEVARLLELLSHQTASLLNTTSLSNDLRLDRQTVERYLTILERLFLVRRLQPWHRNSAKRLIKTPKLHLVDSGLAASLSGLADTDWNSHRDRFGHVLESWVLQQLIAQAGWTDPDLRFWHYRDKDQVEVDVVITHGRKVWGIEVKASATLHDSDGKGLRRLAAQTGADFQGGIVLYDGNTILPTGIPKVLAVPLELLWEW
jgi:hypothetical protein